MAFHLLAAFLLGCIIFPLGPCLSCSPDTFLQRTQICVNKFFDSLKESSKGNCSEHYGQLLNCTKQELVHCLNQSEAPEISATVLSRARQITATEKYFCEDGMLNSLDQYNRSHLPQCRKKVFKKVRKCALSFRETFRQDKGSNSLCRKYSRAKICLKRALGNFCEKSKQVDKLVSFYEQPYNPYCPGRVDQIQRRKKSPPRLDNPFGACTTRTYFLLSRICVARFIKTLQQNDGKSCRLAFTNKLQPCVKDILSHCLKDTYKSPKALNRNIDASLARSRAYQQHNYCYGKGLSLPTLEKNQCKKNYLKAKEKCEKDYVEAYRKNKADESLCRKYSRAKKCTKNATLVLCRTTPQLQDEVDFLYDRFNPFCFNLTDPPTKSAPRNPRNSQGPKVKIENAPISGEDTDSASEDGSKDSFRSVPNGTQSGTTPWLGYLLLLTIPIALFRY